MEKSRKGDFYHQTLPVIVLTTFKIQCIHLQHTFVSYQDKIAFFSFFFFSRSNKTKTWPTPLLVVKIPTILPTWGFFLRMSFKPPQNLLKWKYHLILLRWEHIKWNAINVLCLFNFILKLTLALEFVHEEVT